MTVEEKYPLLIGHSLAGRTRLHNIQEVANFICTHGQYGDLVITERDGTPFLNTFGIYIDKISDMEYREKLLKVLIPMQMEIDGTNDIDKTNETEEQNMNNFEAERCFAQRMKDNYPPGTRIILLQMDDDPRPIEPNTRGTVVVVDDMGTLHCHFDNGRQLGIVPGEDSFRRLTDQELAEEKDSQKRQLTEMSEDELYERDILRFDSFDDFFDFIYDENTDKADIINDMSQQMKRQIISENYGERFIEADGAYYYNSECFTQMALPQSDKEDNAPVFGM